jgi:hypothetical protein
MWQWFTRPIQREWPMAHRIDQELEAGKRITAFSGEPKSFVYSSADPSRLTVMTERGGEQSQDRIWVLCPVVPGLRK